MLSAARLSWSNRSLVSDEVLPLCLFDKSGGFANVVDVRTICHVRLMVSVLFKFVQHLLKDTSGIPAGKSGVDALPWPEALGQIAPRQPRFSDVADRIHEGPVRQYHWAPPVPLGALAGRALAATSIQAGPTPRH